MCSDFNIRGRRVLQKARDAALLLVGPAHRGLAGGEVVVEQPSVGDEVDRREADLGERAARDDAFEQAGIVIG